jgi:hypothetical protein
MSHVRKQIRDAVVAALPGTVYASRVWPVQESDLPVHLVYMGTEQAEELDFKTLDRRLEVVIECVAQALDDDLDALIVGVEQALGAGVAPAMNLRLLSVEIVNSAEGSAPIGRARMTYEARYVTSFADPETSL